MGQTFVPQTDEEREAKADELVGRAIALGWRGQNELARRAGKNPGHVSQVLRGLVKGGPTWAALERALTKAERRAARTAS
jgi:hypothetical protein